MGAAAAASAGAAAACSSTGAVAATALQPQQLCRARPAGWRLLHMLLATRQLPALALLAAAHSRPRQQQQQVW
jgi:hypothetical protein